MKKIIDLVGQKFNRFTVLRYDGKDNNKHHRWLCVCDCGAERSVCSGDLKNGKSKSCGCLSKEMLLQANLKHGQSAKCITPEYRAWKQMKARCYGINNPKYKDYGARGISVCKRWKNDFEKFFEDMGKRPSEKHSLDRINVDGNYCPSNCRWATPKEQANNTRRNKSYKQRK